MKRVFLATALVAATAACDTDAKPTSATNDATPPAPVLSPAQEMAGKLQTACRAAGESNIVCKDGTEGSTTYIGCRWGGEGDSALVFYMEGGSVYAANGKALQMVPKLNQAWIKEGPRPLPAGVDIQAGLRVTK